MFCSFISRLEVLGIPKLNLEDEIEIKTFFNDLELVEYNSQIDEIAFSIRKLKSIKIPDAIIAASAIHTNSILVTRNTKDFQHIPNLKLLNPFET